VLPAPAAAVARALEAHAYPRLYRRTPLVTLSPSTRDELVALGHRPEQVTVVRPGVDPRYRPGGTRAPHPLVVTVGRLVGHKRVDLLVDALAPLRDRHPGLELLVVGAGPDLDRLASLAPPWVTLAGRVPDDALVDAYRRAWVVASASVAEGWNMTLSEAGACATPAVASRIAGHADAVADGETGFLVDDRDGFTAAFDRLLGDAALRARLGEGARRHAAACDWDLAAATVLGLLGCAPDPARP
jgi:glycosyltransferase involved in cell wall biosynthesis